MNWGLSDELKEAFPNVVPVARPLVKVQKFPYPNWLAGFTSAEGCFLVKLNFKYKTGVQVQLEFKLTQHSRDEELLKTFIKFFGCGRVSKDRKSFNYKVNRLIDIIDKIIPFFQKHPWPPIHFIALAMKWIWGILGVKALDFADWCKVAEMMKYNKHLTPEGLEQIIKIKAGMNKGRK